MKGVVVVVLLSIVCVLCEGQGSGDDVIVITPSSKAAPTDATNDSGSGDDDEDNNDGSGVSSTSFTTTSSSSSSVHPTTRFDDSEDGSGGSGSGSGTFGKTVESTMATTADNTDMYMSETTTPKVTAQVFTMPRITPGKTTHTTDSVDPSTGRITNSIVVDTTTTEKPTEKKTRQPSVRIVTSEKTTTVRETIQRHTEKPPRETVSVDESTSVPPNRRLPTEAEPTINPNILNSKNDKPADKPDPGFTLTTEVIAGVVGCALLALLLIAFLMYRLKKRDEGSYLLDDPYEKKMSNSDKEAFV